MGILSTSVSQPLSTCYDRIPEMYCPIEGRSQSTGRPRKDEDKLVLSSSSLEDGLEKRVILANTSWIAASLVLNFNFSARRDPRRGSSRSEHIGLGTWAPTGFPCCVLLPSSWSISAACPRATNDGRSNYATSSAQVESAGREPV
jgi:hypothetical protein